MISKTSTDTCEDLEKMISLIRPGFNSEIETLSQCRIKKMANGWEKPSDVCNIGVYPDHRIKNASLTKVRMLW